jgi:hypothetical protein
MEAENMGTTEEEKNTHFLDKFDGNLWLNRAPYQGLAI